MDGKDAKKLTKKLDKVNKALDKDKINKACKIMDKFIKKVDKFNAKDKLDQAEADLLKETV
ncbi:MAG: hypothetical protein HRO68_01125 [Nitrosopumilus sp.]|nr:hypothetical protein [Nitrosopumilus sp.]